MHLRQLLIGVCLTSCVTHAELLPITNDEMSDEAGQGPGVALSLDMRLNADINGTVLPLCTAAATRRECRFAVSFNNRGTDNVDKQWLVFKGMSGRIYVPYLTLDGSSVTYTSDVTSLPVGITAMKFGFGGATAAKKIQIKNFVIDNIAVELDNAASPGFMKDTGTSGAGTNTTAAYLAANANSGFMGMQIAGYCGSAGGCATDQLTANIAVNGTLKVFACPANHPSC